MTNTKHLLLVCHCPSENTIALRDAATDALRGMDLQQTRVRVCAPLEADAENIRKCDGLLIGATENFGAMAGLVKDFFERIYYPCLDETQGLPVAVYVRAGEDGRGARQGIEKVMAGLRWRSIAETLILRGPYTEQFEEQVAELAMTLGAGVDAGIF